jgi:hypothetical protein
MPDESTKPQSVGTPLALASEPQSLLAQKISLAAPMRTVGVSLSPERWEMGDLELVHEAIFDMQTLLGGDAAMQAALGGVKLERLLHGGGGAYAWWIFPTWHRITLGDDVLHQDPPWRGKVAVVHELAHIWDAQSGNWFQRALGAGGRIVHDMSAYVGAEPGPTCYGGLGAPECMFPRKPVEEWAESFAAYCYPEYINWLRANNPNEKEAGLRPLHKQFVTMEIERLKQSVGSINA